MNYSNTHHSFSVELAEIYGIEEAILIHHFQHWIKHNRRLRRNFKEGRWWTYQTRGEIAAHFPYFSPEKVRNILEKLCLGKERRSTDSDLNFEPILIKGNFNKSSFDRTIWYAFKDEEKFIGNDTNSNNSYDWSDDQMDGSNDQIRSGQMTTPIPHSITDTKTEEREGAAPPNPAHLLPQKSKKDLTIPPPKRKKAVEEKSEKAERIFVSESQHEALLKKANGDEKIVQSWYGRLSDWKIGKGITGGANDYQAIIKWVISAVEEDKMSGKGKNSASEDVELIKRLEAHPTLITSGKLIVGPGYVEFPQIRDAHFRIGEHGFQEKILNTLRKMGVPIKQNP